MTLGDLIKEYRNNNKLSLRDFAQKCGLSHTYISALEKNIDSRTGKPIAPTLDTVKYISKGMNISIEDILKILDDEQEFKMNAEAPKFSDNLSNHLKNIGTMYVSNSHLVKLPILGTVKAGYDYMAQENWIGYIDVEKVLLKEGSEYFALKITGDSMSPTLLENDIVIIRKQDDFENGDIVVAIINGNEATIKKAKKTDNTILLQPLNPIYEPLIFTYEEIKTIPVTIVGIVKQLKREF